MARAIELWQRGRARRCQSRRRETPRKHGSCIPPEIQTASVSAAAWTADKLYVSVDGKPFAERPYDFSLGKLAGSVCVKTSYWDEKRDRNATSLSSSTIDEVTVFNRKLTNAEIDSIYENTKNAALSHSVGAARFADAAQLLFGGGEPLHGCGANGIIHIEPRK